MSLEALSAQPRASRLKGITQLRPIRYWLAEYVHAHVFVCYLAYLLLSLLQYRLRKTDFTAESALLELNTMYKVCLRGAKRRFRLSRVVSLTKKRELILKTIDRSLLDSSTASKVSWIDAPDSRD